jgi:hypothetical protein
MIIHVPDPDPYVGLFRMIGGKPQVLCHGDDLPAGSVATWDARHGALAGTTSGTPSSNASGWAGSGSATFRTLTLSTSQYVAYNSEASNYASTTPLLWIVGVKFTAQAAARNFVALGASATVNNYRGVHINATDGSFFWSNRNGTSETDAGSNVTESVQALWGIHLKDDTATMIQRTSGGNTTLLSTTHAMSGTLSVNRFTLGALLLNDAQSAATALGEYRFFCAMRSPSANAADLPNILAYVQHNLRCPL